MEHRMVVKLFALASTAAGLFFSPSVSAAPSPLGAGTACANGTCCQESGSICSLDSHFFENRYYLSSGSCAGS